MAAAATEEEDQPAELTWNKSLEEYLCNTSEQCMGYAWLHKRCEEMYSRRTVFLDLPTIIIGAVNGFISVGSKQLFKDDAYAPVYIGGISLFVSILSTVNSYFSWGRKAESHKIASNAYSKLYRFIAVEMNTKPRSERIRPKKLLDMVRSQYDQLGESSPLIPPMIINDFNKRFAGLKDFSLPEETNGLHAVYSFTSSSPPNSPETNLNMPISIPALQAAGKKIISETTITMPDNVVDHNHVGIKITESS